MSPLISIAHPTPNPFSRNAAKAIDDLGYLKSIITTIAYNPQHPIAKGLKSLSQYGLKIHQELDRRTWISPGKSKLYSYPWPELWRILSIKSKISKTPQGCMNWVCQSLDIYVAKHHLKNVNAIYAYEDCAATTFHIAKLNNILCLYDLPIPFYQTSRRIQQEESELFPELARSLQAIDEPQWKLDRKEQEITLADHIFVASSMTYNSLLEIGIPNHKISVIPYGAPIDYFQPHPKTDSTFRALFVGRVGPRKGVHYLLQAWKELQLPQADLHLVGVNEFPPNWLYSDDPTIHFTPSVPHHTLHHFYTNSSVFIFPSLVEGFGLVLLEAMACGIPVITTPNTAGPDIITDGIEGFIVPIRDTEALKEKIEWCYRYPTALKAMGIAARKKAEFLTWDLYRSRLSEKIKNLLEFKNYT